MIDFIFRINSKRACHLFTPYIESVNIELSTYLHILVYLYVVLNISFSLLKIKKKKSYVDSGSLHMFDYGWEGPRNQLRHAQAQDVCISVF
jgi:hypothetical protein